MPTQYDWQDAAAYAARAHEYQKRRDGNTPYFSHPARVAMIVACVFGVNDETTLTAALLHDVIEDTDHDYDDIYDAFGKPVADIVACLTKDMRLIESKREPAYDRQLARGPWAARLIKLADVYDNLTDAANIASRNKMIKKARRALKLASNERRLGKPRAIVARLVKLMAARRR